MAKSNKVKVGDVFNKLTVIKEVEKWIYPTGKTRRQFLMQCSCGSPAKKILISGFMSGKTKSCGCFGIERMTSHGMHSTRQYQCWADMKTRCDCEDNKFYSYYGGRGIKYCSKWKTFEGFWEDMQEGYSDDLTINRRDNDGMYCKENCRWDTKNFQGHMRRKRKGTKLDIIGGELTKDGSIKARISNNVSHIHLGSYITENDAAMAYDYAASIIYGDRPNKTPFTTDRIIKKVDNYFKNFEKDLRQNKGSSNLNAVLNKEQVVAICRMLDSGVVQKDIVKEFNVSRSTISGICCGRIYTEESGRPRVYKQT